MRQQTALAARPADRVLGITRLFDAPRAVVFEAFVDPKQALQWLGPRGYTMTHMEADLRVGGAWRGCMRRERRRTRSLARRRLSRDRAARTPRLHVRMGIGRRHARHRNARHHHVRGARRQDADALLARRVRHAGRLRRLPRRLGERVRSAGGADLAVLSALARSGERACGWRISFSQGAAWKALISTYIGTIPLSGDVCAGAQSMSAAPPPRTPVSSAMMAKVGAAARHSQSAAPSAAALPLS